MTIDLSHRREGTPMQLLFCYLAIIVVCFFSFFVNNQIIPADLMESRNLATAQEMVREGNYLIPTMNGELRLEKPPLPTWVASVIDQVAPGDLVAQRYAAGVMGTVMVFFLFFLVREFTRGYKVALFAALVLATCYNTVLMGRTATWDIYCHSFMLGAIYYLTLALRREGAQWPLFFLAGLFMGLSFLSKGPVSFFALLLPFIIAYAIVYRTKWKGKVPPLIAMVLLCLFVSFWWTIYLMLTHPEMMLRVAQKESTSWLDHNVRPWYYYWKFPAEVGIWALFLVTAIGYFFVRRTSPYRDLYRFSFFWFLASLALLSALPEKKTRYLLPILIPAAILIGLYIFQSIKIYTDKLDKTLFRVNAVVVALILIAAPVALYFLFYSKGEMSIAMLMLSAVAGLGLGSYILYGCFNKRGIAVNHVFTGIILGMIMVVAICLPAIGSMFINAERHSIRMLREDSRVEGLPFYHDKNESLRMELVYEANKTIRPLDIENDSLFYSALPFVFVGNQSADSLLAGKHVTSTLIDVFDNNWRQTGSKRYNWDLVTYVVLVKKAPAVETVKPKEEEE